MCLLVIDRNVSADKLAAKAQKITIKLPWEIMTMFSDVLATDDEEDEDDVEAHEASLQRLKASGHIALRGCGADGRTGSR